MKKLFICLSVIGVLLVSCSNDYDDSALWDSVNGLENRVAKLEELCKQMNTNISSLQEIVKALKERESITNVSTLSDGSGYSITFTSGKTIAIYHGKNGSDGSDGTNGVTPTISVKQDTDGIYYWTVNGNWLVVDGKKVKAIGTDGADGSDGNDGTDGTNGKDGITPKFKIDGGYWYISYDNEQNWEQLGKATGDSGLNGEDGNAFFKGVSMADGFVVFTLNDKESTEIKIPFYSETELTVHVTEPGTLKSLLTDEQMRTVLSLKVIGNINDEDIQTIDASMLVVENVDLSDTDITALPKGAFCGGDLLYGKQTLKKIILPQTCKVAKANAFYGCRNLSEIIAPGAYNFGTPTQKLKLIIGTSDDTGKCAISCNVVRFEFSEKTELLSNNSQNKHCTNLICDTIYFPATLKLEGAALSGCPVKVIEFDKASMIETIGNYNAFGAFADCANLQQINIPASVRKICPAAFRKCVALEKVIFPDNSALDTIGGEYAFQKYAGAFENCTALKEITLPAKVSVIEKMAFRICSSLEKIIIKSPFLRYVAPSAFYDCTSLKQLICYRTTPPSVGQWFSSIPRSCILYVPRSSISAYQSDKYWGAQFATILAIEDL